MATYTVSTDINVDDILSGGWVDISTLNINNGATVTVNTNQTKAWQFININNGNLRIENDSTTEIITFALRRNASGTNTNINIYGLGDLEVQGNWVEIGTGDGTSNQTLTYPAAGRANAVWVETGVGTDEWQIWLNGTMTDGVSTMEWWDSSWEATIGNGLYGRYFQQPLVVKPYNASLPVSAQSTNQLIFGDDVHGNKIPVGARVRVPNIIMTDITPSGSQYSGSTLNSLATIYTTNTGGVSLDTCNIDYLHLGSSQAKYVTLTNCAFWRMFDIDECSAVSINHVGVGVSTVLGVQYNGTPVRWNNMDYRRSYADFSYVSNIAINDFHAACETSGTGTTVYDFLQISYSTNVTIDGLRIHYLRPYNFSNTLRFNYVTNATVSNLDITLALPEVTNSSNITFSNITIVSSLVDGYACYHYIDGVRLNLDPATGSSYLDNVPYYIKYLTYFDWYDLAPPTEHYTQCVVPYTAVNGAPVYFGVRVTAPTSAYWIWAAHYPYAPSGTIWELFAGDTPGFTRDLAHRIYSSTTAATANYTWSTLTASTTYYCVLRKWVAAGVYVDTSEQIITTPAATPALIKNSCLGPEYFTSTSWVKTDCTATSDVATLPGMGRLDVNSADRITSTSTNGYMSQTFTVVSGQTYSFAIYLYTDVNPFTTEISLTSGVNSQTTICDITQKYDYYTITCVAAATTMVVRIAGNSTLPTGYTLLGGYASFNLGSTPFPYTSSTTDITNCSGITSLSILSQEGVFAGIDVAIDTIRGCRRELHVGTSPDFTPSAATRVGMSAHSPSVFRLENANNVDISAITMVGVFGCFGEGSSATYRTPFYLVSCTGITIHDLSLDFRFSCERIANITTGSTDITIKNVEITKHVGYGASPIITDNSCADIVFQKVTISPNPPVSIMSSNTICKGLSGGRSFNPTLGDSSAGLIRSTSFTGVYDNNFYELYDNTTEGRLELRFTASTKTQKPYTLVGNTKFDNLGRLYFGSVGSSATFTWPHKIVGVTGFRNLNANIYKNYMGILQTTLNELLLCEYQIDGGVWKQPTAANLYSEVINPDGFDLSVRFSVSCLGISFDNTTGTVQAGDTLIGATSGCVCVIADIILATGITGFAKFSSVTGVPVDNEWLQLDATHRVYTAGTLSPNDQSYLDAFALYTTIDLSKSYPEDGIEFTVTGLVSGSDVTILSAGTETILANVEDVSGTSYTYSYTTSHAVDITVYKQGYIPAYIRNYTLSSTDASLPITQNVDPSYLD